VDRAIRIIAEATGVERAEAERLFEAAGRNVKQARLNHHG
jgi:N-acetylmuramic acid 6-phosphate (MurNAc-6-P) etherase